MNAPDKHLITFLLLAYNQERFIREAVVGAFAQTYTPLEIILSDDCSSDGTFALMSEMAASYSGPHTIVLNRNERNLGIGAHINRVMEFASGELIVAAAGDDISVSERTSRICEEWLRHGSGCYSLYSDVNLIDDEGRQSGCLFEGRSPDHAQSLKQAIVKGRVGVSGCSHAFSRKTFDLFGPMDDRVVAEDMVIPFRSLLLGDIRFLSDPLVQYRVHSGNISIGSTRRPTLARRSRDTLNQEAVILTWIHDVRKACLLDFVTQQDADSICFELYEHLLWMRMERSFYARGWIAGLYYLFRRWLNISTLSRAAKLIERRCRSLNSEPVISTDTILRASKKGDS